MPLKFQDDRILQTLGLNLKTPTGIICSFCNGPVDKATATYGLGAMRGRSELKLVLNDPHYIQHRNYMQQDKVVACLHCCLKVEKVTFPPDKG